MTDAELKNAIKTGVRGGYLFFGVEEYLMRQRAAEFRMGVLSGDATFDAFNHTILEGDVSPEDLEKAVSTLPLMAEKTLVEWYSPSMNAWKEETATAFAAVFSRLGEYPHAVLLITVGQNFFDPGTLPKRPSALYKKLSEHLSMVEFPLQSEERLKRWLARHFSRDGLTAQLEVYSLILDTCGRQMYVLSGEVEKLIAYVKAAGREEVTVADAEAVLSPGLDDDAFALANAAMQGDRRGAIQALYAHKLRREEPIVLLASVSRVMCDLLAVARLCDIGMSQREIAQTMKMHEYKCGLYVQSVKGVETERLASALRRCQECDKRLKRGGLGYETLERLICTIPQRKRKG